MFRRKASTWGQNTICRYAWKGLLRLYLHGGENRICRLLFYHPWGHHFGVSVLSCSGVRLCRLDVDCGWVGYQCGHFPSAPLIKDCPIPRGFGGAGKTRPSVISCSHWVYGLDQREPLVRSPRYSRSPASHDWSLGGVEKPASMYELILWLLRLSMVLVSSSDVLNAWWPGSGIIDDEVTSATQPRSRRRRVDKDSTSFGIRTVVSVAYVTTTCGSVSGSGASTTGA